MRFRVRDKRPYLMAALLAIGCAVTAHGQVQCECANPPGGSVSCDRNQIAKCSVRDGQVFGSCSRVSGNLKGDEFWAFVLHEVTGDRVMPAALRQEKYKGILRERKYVNEKGEVTFFSLPEDAPMLPEWAKESPIHPFVDKQKPKKPLPVKPRR